MAGINKYVDLARDYNMLNAMIIAPEQIYFDIRSILKCRWGCEDFSKNSIKCHSRNTTFNERIEIVKRYKQILIVHAHNARELNSVLLKLERMAFLDGYYFASALCCCNLCPSCQVDKGSPCPTPEKIRPCEQLFGIDVYKTVRSLGWPCQVLQHKEDIPNRFGFLLID